jgi:hypothetical protein
MELGKLRRCLTYMIRQCSGLDDVTGLCRLILCAIVSRLRSWVALQSEIRIFDVRSARCGATRAALGKMQIPNGDAGQVLG